MLKIVNICRFDDFVYGNTLGMYVIIKSRKRKDKDGK